MSEKLITKKSFFSVDSMIDTLEEMHGSKEKRIEFEKFYKSFVVKASENVLSNQSKAWKKLVEESEVFSLLIKEKSKEFDENAKEIYAMGRFAGAYDAFGTWCKMYFDSSEYEKTMTKILNKKHVPEILYCVKQHPGIQNKKILETVKIKPNHLSELTSEMIYYQIISRYSIGKNTFYELTPRAKEYFRKKERREYHIRLSKQKMDMYIALYADKELIASEPRTPYFEEYRERKPIKVRKVYFSDINMVPERSIYNV